MRMAGVNKRDDRHRDRPRGAIMSLWISFVASLAVVAMIPTVGWPQAATQDSLIQLPIPVHLMHSAESVALTTSWTEQDVTALLAIANLTWRQAGIEWTLESIVEAEARNGAAFDSMLARRMPATGEKQRSIIPRDSLLEPAWNLFLIRNYGRIAGGVFWPELPALVLAEQGMGVDLGPSGRGGRTLAHELGHSLGLDHEECVPASPNVMATGCWRPGLDHMLTAAQIRRARVQAQTGRPVNR